MTFNETALAGVFLIDCDVFPDERGYFARAWAPEEFESRGLEAHIAQCSLAFNRLRGTIRGLHYQSPPFDEAKLVRVTRGAIYDVVLDLRPDSSTFRQWCGAELTVDNRRMLYVPRGVAHGYQTLSDDTDVFYFVSTRYSPAHQRGVRWDDPAFGIRWPLGAPAAISERDRSFPDYPRVGSTPS